MSKVVDQIAADRKALSNDFSRAQTEAFNFLLRFAETFIKMIDFPVTAVNAGELMLRPFQLFIDRQQRDGITAQEFERVLRLLNHDLTYLDLMQ